MKKLREVFRLKFELAYSNRQIGRSVDISPGTVSDYLNLFKLTELSWSEAQAFDDEKLEQMVYRHPTCSSSASLRPQPDWHTVHQELKQKGVTLQLVWREYREREANGLGYTQFTKLYRTYVKTLEPVMRFNHKAGEKCFVDYAGLVMRWTEHKTGEVHDAQIFVGCLGGSSLIYAEATGSQTLPDWIASHVRMFEAFGGVSETLVPDNLKSGVHKAHRYDPDLNPTYMMFAQHYKVAVIPTRSVSPRDKAKVESSVQCVERDIIAPLRHHPFTSLGEINVALKEQLHALNQKPMQRIEVSRQAQFESFEKATLRPLPKQRFELQTWRQAKVHIDYHISVDKRFYSVPYHLIGKRVDVCLTQHRIEMFYKAVQVAIHSRAKIPNQFSTQEVHMPPQHRHYLQEEQDASIVRLKTWAKEIGPSTVACVDKFFAVRVFPQQAVRAVLGLKRLAAVFGNKPFEAACHKMLELNQFRYKTVETILKHKLCNVVTVDDAAKPQHNPAHFRGAEYYQ